MMVNPQSPESTPTFVFHDGEVRAVLDTRVYRVVAVQKTGYRFADRCTLVLGQIEEHRQPLALVFPPNTKESVARETARLFFQELLDQQLREHIGDETHALRALILAHAFSRTDLIRRD